MNNNRELKVKIESAIRCASNCDGCILTKEERRGKFFPSLEYLEKAKLFINKYIKVYNDFEELFLVGVQADHLLLSNEEIDSLYKMVDGVEYNDKSFVITTSAVNNENVLQKKTDFIHDISVKNKLPNFFAVILDPLKEDKKTLSDKYYRNINYIKNKFGSVDLEINISPLLVKNFTPKDVLDFVLVNKFKVLNINYVFTSLNKEHFKNSLEDIVLWFVEFFDLYFRDEKYSEIYVVFVQRIKKIFDLIKVKNNIVEIIANNLLMDIYIDSEGRVFFSQTGFGDLALTNRNNFKELCNIYDENINFESIRKQALVLAQKMSVFYDKHKSCLNCPHKEACMLSGSVLQLNIMNSDVNSKKCPISLDVLFNNIVSKNYYKILEKDEFHKDQIFQKGLFSGRNKDLFEFKNNIEKIEQLKKTNV